MAIYKEGTNIFLDPDVFKQKKIRETGKIHVLEFYTLKKLPLKIKDRIKSENKDGCWIIKKITMIENGPGSQQRFYTEVEFKKYKSNGLKRYSLD